MDKDILNKQQMYLSDKLCNSTVTISGATGLIGSRVTKYLLDLNRLYNASITVNALYRNREKFDAVFQDYSDCHGLKPMYADSDTKLSGRTDYVLHCAGISGGTKMHLKDPIVVFDTAYNGTKNLLDFASEAGCKRFVFVSTYEIYGTPADGHLLTENEPCSLDTMVLRNIYSECKRMCESMCVAYSSKYGIDVMCGRLTSTFGYGVKYDDPRFFAEFARCVIKEKDIVLKSMGTTVRSYLDSDDAASAFLYILVNGESCNIYNVTNMDNEISIREIAERIIRIANNKSQLKFEVSGDITSLGYRKDGKTLMDASKLYALGWKPIYTFDDTIKKLIDIFKQ